MKSLVVPAAIASLFIATEAAAQVVKVPKTVPRAPSIPVPVPKTPVPTNPAARLPKVELVSPQMREAMKAPVIIEEYFYMPQRFSSDGEVHLVITGHNLDKASIAGAMPEAIPSDCSTKCQLMWREFAQGLGAARWSTTETTAKATIPARMTKEVYAQDPTIDCDRLLRAVTTASDDRTKRLAQSSYDDNCVTGRADWTEWEQLGALKTPLLLRYRVGSGSSQTKRISPGGLMVTDRDGDGVDAIVFPGGSDCDDNDANRYPGNDEVADFEGHDEDCDFRTIGVRDTDNDGFTDWRVWNNDGSNNPPTGKDCDDSRIGVNPRQGEIPNNRLDDNCDGNVDWDESWPAAS